MLSDFREVEQNFRLLDRSVRERIALWEGGKAALFDELMGRRDAIDDSDQGRSFRAFWDFLMSDSRQQELTALLETILEPSPSGNGCYPPQLDMPPVKSYLRSIKTTIEIPIPLPGRQNCWLTSAKPHCVPSWHRVWST
jgi:hypothetical protein